MGSSVADYKTLKMSQVQIVKAGNDPAMNDEKPVATTHLVHETGDIVSSSALVQAPAQIESQYFQKVPENDLGDFLSRFVEIRGWNISNLDTPLQSIGAGNDIWTAFLMDPSVADKTKSFSLIRGTLEVLIQCTMPGGGYGSYVWNAIANGKPIDAVTTVSPHIHPANCMQVDQFARVDCASAENIVFQLPWIYRYDFASLPAGPVQMWEMDCICLSPLRSGIDGGNTTGSFKMFARLLPGYILSVPHFQGHRRGHLEPTPTTAKHMPATHKKLQVSGVADKVGAVASKLSGLPIVGPYAATAAKVAHGVGKIAHMFGFTRESDYRNPLSTMQRSVTNVAPCDGADSGDSASLMTVNEISIDSSIADGVVEDVSSFASLFNRWTFLKKITWTSGSSSETTLGSVYVSPFACYRPSAGECHFSPAGYVGLPFALWRGDMEYLVVIPASKFHRGSLQIYWIPFASASPGSITNITLNTIIDLGSGEEHTFGIGYARERPFLERSVINEDFTIINQGAANGTLCFRVVNPLVSQSTTATVDILVFHRACANMQFAVPTSAMSYADIAVPANPPKTSDMLSAFKLQGGALGDEDNHEFVHHQLVSESGDYPADDVLFGERISSVRSLMQKPSRLYVTGGTPLNDTEVANFMGPLPTWTDGTNPNIFDSRFTFAGFYRALFVGIAASERYKFFPKKDCMIGAAPDFETPAVAFTQFMSNLAATSFVGANMGYEVTLPFYYNNKFIAGNESYKATDARVNKIYVSIAKGETVVPEVAVYYSFGPDIRITRFRQVPKVIFTNHPGLVKTFWVM